MKLEVNIEKRYAYGIIGLLILVFGFLVVNAYGTSTPAVFGHSAGEIEEADPTVPDSIKDGIAWGELSGIPGGFEDGIDDEGEEKMFGGWESKEGNTIYQALTDGFVVAHIYSSSGRIITGYTDGNNPPSTRRVINEGDGNVGSASITMPVRQGNYWRIEVTGAVTVYWIPFGN